MMRKGENRSLKSKPETEAYSQANWSPHAYPATIGRRITKQLKCQSLHCGIAIRREQLILSTHRRFTTFKLRQSSAVGIFGKG